MKETAVNRYLSRYGKFFEDEALPYVRNALRDTDDVYENELYQLNLKDPMLMTAASLAGGVFGIDRFLLGEVGMGILKLCTGGLFGFLTVADWIRIRSKAKQKNYDTFMNAVAVFNGGSYTPDRSYRRVRASVDPFAEDADTVCPYCGARVGTLDRYCESCGKKIK